MEQCTICGADVRHHILCRWPHLITSPLRQFNLNDVMEEEKHMMVPQRLPSITPAESVEGIGGVQGYLQHESAQTPSQSGLTDGRGYRRAPEPHSCPGVIALLPSSLTCVTPRTLMAFSSVDSVAVDKVCTHAPLLSGKRCEHFSSSGCRLTVSQDIAARSFPPPLHDKRALTPMAQLYFGKAIFEEVLYYQTYQVLATRFILVPAF